MALNDNIKQLREINQWSQEEMAQQINMSKNGYAKIERGESKPNLDRLQQIAQVFDISLIELIESDNKGIVCLINENSDNNFNHYGDAQSFVSKIEQLELTIKYKDEILEQKNHEISALKEVIELLKKESD